MRNDQKDNSVNKYILLLLFPFLIAGCSSKFRITGRYGSKESPYSFDINQDSTYYYKFYQFHEYEYSTGKWHGKGYRAIVLNSNNQNITIPLLQVESSKNLGGNINRFSFEFESNGIAAKDCECAIIINGATKVIRRCDSIALVEIGIPVSSLFVEIRKSPLLMTSLRFSLDPLITHIYSTPNNYGNFIKFKIVVNDSLFSYEVFKNRKLKFRKNGIYFYDNKGIKKHWIPKLTEE
jgi:hypothetical protein